MAERSRSSCSRNYTAEEAVDLSLDDDAELPSYLVEDVESDDGDGGEADYVAEDGSSQLVPPELLSCASELVPVEPAFEHRFERLTSSPG